MVFLLLSDVFLWKKYGRIKCLHKTQLTDDNSDDHVDKGIREVQRKHNKIGGGWLSQSVWQKKN